MEKGFDEVSRALDEERFTVYWGGGGGGGYSVLPAGPPPGPMVL